MTGIDDHHALVPAHSRALVENPNYDEAWTRVLFNNFRSFFAADRLQEREVFWMESQGSHLILRHVKNLGRLRKGQDNIVGRVINDAAAAKVLIGNYAAGAKMSTVRWELYTDFELTNLLEQGRFDYRDLLGNVSDDDAQFLATHGIAPSGDWDFDAIVLTHRCPLCRRVFDTASVIYNPDKDCESCGRPPKQDDSLHIIQDLLLGYGQRLDRFPGLKAEGDPTRLQDFIDPVPNSIVCWILSATRLTTERPLGEDFFGNAVTRQWLEAAKRRSIFGYATYDFLRDEMNRVLSSQGMDWTITLAGLQLIGKTLRRQYMPAGNDRDNTDYASDQIIAKIRDMLPELINQIILDHGHYPIPERKL